MSAPDIQSFSLATDTSITNTSSYTLAQVGSAQVTVTIGATTDIVNIVTNAAYRPFNDAAEKGIGYQIDSGTAVHTTYAYRSTTTTAQYLPLVSSVWVTGLSVGSHTIKLMAFANGTNWSLLGDASTFAGMCFFQAVVIHS